MRALALVAVLALAGCQPPFIGGGGMPAQDPLTIGFLPTSTLPRASTGTASRALAVVRAESRTEVASAYGQRPTLGRLPASGARTEGPKT